MRLVFRNPVRSFGLRARPNSITEVTPLDRPEFLSPLAVGEDVGVEAAATHYPVSPEEAAVLEARIAALEDKLAKKPSARTRIQPAIDEAKALLAGTAQWEIALRWIRNRAKGLKGELDLDALRYGLYFLGWKLQLSTEVTTHIHDLHSLDNRLPRELTHTGYAYIEDLPEGVQVYKGKKAGRKDLPSGNYVTRWERLGEFVETPAGVEAEGSSSIDQTKLPDYVYALYGSNLDMRPYIGKPIVDFGDAFTVAHGRQTLVTVTNQHGQSATFTGTGGPAWKALYGLGLEEAAAAMLPPLERAATKAREERESWGKSLCAVCFGKAAVTPRKGTMVDHGHQRPGVGFNVGPCAGNRFPTYSVSDEGTRAILDAEKRAFKAMATRADAMIAHPKDQVFDAVRPVYEKGRRVKELNPSLIAMYGDYKVEPFTVRYGDPDYDRVYDIELKKLIIRLMNCAENIGFYGAAVRIWTPNNTTRPEDIKRAVREADKPHHPLLLARVNPRRAQRNPRKRRARRNEGAPSREAQLRVRLEAAQKAVESAKTYDDADVALEELWKVEAELAKIEASEIAHQPATTTPKFRKWFGKSKVVDTQGRPLKVYHGSEAAGFTVFQTLCPTKPGFFFTDNLAMARSYAPQHTQVVLPYFRTLKEVLGFESSAQFPLTVKKKDGGYDVYFAGSYLGFYGKGKTKDMLAKINGQSTRYPGVYEAYLRIENPMVIDANGDRWDAVTVTDDDGYAETMNTNEISRMAHSRGYDGVIIRDIEDAGGYGDGGESGDVYIAFDPNQIKSTQNIGSYSRDTDDLRLNPRRSEPRKPRNPRRPRSRR